MILSKILFFVFVTFFYCFPAVSQLQFTGEVVDSLNNSPLAYVNIGIKDKNVGTSSRKDGSFTLDIPSGFINDTITFSMVGYLPVHVLVADLNAGSKRTVRLLEMATPLEEVVVAGDKLVEKKFGIKRRGAIHFTDGIFSKDDSFEIGQVIDLGNELAQLSSLNLHINTSRPDSGSFRINFYRYDDHENRPGDRIIEKNIFQRHPIKEGWLRFDLTIYNIILNGKVFAAIEFIPERKEDISQIFFEVKLGGKSKSFYRRNSLGSWNAPPHHYCLFVTAKVDKHTRDEPEDIETLPEVKLISPFHKEAFSIFVRLPKGYRTKNKDGYPVIYHLDGNAYFDQVCASVERLSKKKMIRTEPIIVGIGYDDVYVMDSLRNRDYTFPAAQPADSFGISGGGRMFYDFISTRLLPYMEKRYNVDTTRRTIMGHSIGGYFVLFAFLQSLNGPPLFNNFVAASPSISYFDDYLVKQFRGTERQAVTKFTSKLFLSVGEIENSDDTTFTFSRFSDMLSKYSFLQLNARVYENMEHMGTAIPSFEDGIEFVMTE